MTVTKRWWAGLILGFGVLASAGCGGPSTGEVAGSVNAGGKPLANGIVNFFPEQGTPLAATVKDGFYRLSDVPYGSYRLTVLATGEPPGVTTSGSGRPLKPGEVDPTARAAPKAKPKAQVADKYTKVDESGLTCKVEKAMTDNPISLD